VHRQKIRTLQRVIQIHLAAIVTAAVADVVVAERHRSPMQISRLMIQIAMIKILVISPMRMKEAMQAQRIAVVAVAEQRVKASLQGRLLMKMVS
jgi:hypothetical protein